MAASWASWGPGRGGWRCCFWTRTSVAGAWGALLTYGLEQYAIREVTVNEQNPAALGFYRHFGFREYRRTETDEEGGPYPLLYLRREG